MKEISTSEFLALAAYTPVIDVRAPAEYTAGHIPGAFSLPVFDDRERAQVGTAYKQRSRTEAMDIGLEIVGPKMRGFVETARGLAPGGEILIHCWRGGMRSASMGWLLETAGFRVSILTGGYKAYRAHIRENLTAGKRFVVLGGQTGSGKTRWLNQLRAAGEQVVDLEGLANHRGSAFGGIGLGNQPTNEQFENELFASLQALSDDDLIWIEDESRSIGSIFMPEPFVLAMKSAPVIRIEVPEEIRIQIILDEYAGLDKSHLAGSIQKISRRLGGLVTQECLQKLEEDDFAGVVRLLLPYYDKTYTHSLGTHPADRIVSLNLSGIPMAQYRDELIKKKFTLIQ
ncbi:MAG: tRNA 2-selenouridine(34) synthase MnmH [Bacteroidetes bacterium GWF2_49_14]|nr:MAG: tRNA 2-selenouridine(34) synthase MnmH [Bacteroidetes bacterium GWF2_49_14]HBB93402.1 tRNA 2-selenouridine(34) synthase MnmH [Bacteroidales bacterium]